MKLCDHNPSEKNLILMKAIVLGVAIYVETCDTCLVQDGEEECFFAMGVSLYVCKIVSLSCVTAVTCNYTIMSSTTTIILPDPQILLPEPTTHTTSIVRITTTSAIATTTTSATAVAIIQSGSSGGGDSLDVTASLFI